MANRVMAALATALVAFFRSIGRVARQLFHEVTGAFFLLFATLGGMSAWRHWRQGSDLWIFGVSLAFALMMAAFAFAAFRSARRTR